MPVVSEHWSSQQPVAIFLEMKASDHEPSDARATQEISGTVVIGHTLGSDFRKRLAQMNVRDGENALLISPGRTPRDNIVEGELFMGGGAALLFVYRLIPRRWKPGLFELGPHRRC